MFESSANNGVGSLKEKKTDVFVLGWAGLGWAGLGWAGLDRAGLGLSWLDGGGVCGEVGVVRWVWWFLTLSLPKVNLTKPRKLLNLQPSKET